ncbi:MAG: hypothetical protein HZA54_14025, partial [Planctomycetes bacterium]|nr:hypothetical protein [Planctomycetota bacterium]
MSGVRAQERAAALAPWLALGLLALAFCSFRIHSHDLGFYVAKGRVTLDTGRIPRMEELLCADYEAPVSWSEKWLFQVLVAAAERAAGADGLVVLRYVLQGLTALFVLLTARRARGREGDAAPAGVVPLVLALALVALCERIDLRPELASYACLAAHLWVLERWRVERAGPLWLCPVVQVLAVNLHTYFVYGPLLVGLWLLGEAAAAARAHGLRAPWPADTARPLRLLFACWIATLLACAVNPRGFAAFAMPFAFAENLAGAPWYARSILEFAPPGVGSPVLTWPTLAFGLLGALALAGVAGSLPGAPLAHVATIAVFLGNACAMRRNIGLFAVLATPLVALHVAPLAGRALAWASRRAPPAPSARVAGTVAAWGLAAALLLGAAAVATDRFYASTRSPVRTGWGLMPHFFPDEALAFLAREGIEGNVFTSFELGSAVLWRAWPRLRPLVDSEADVILDLYRRYTEIMAGARPLGPTADIFHLDVALLQHDRGDPRRMVGALLRSPEWALVWCDDIAAVFLRRAGRHAARLPRPALDPARLELPALPVG